MDEAVKKFLMEAGRKGGKRRMANLTPDERRELARHAGLASGKARREEAAKRRARKKRTWR